MRMGNIIWAAGEFDTLTIAAITSPASSVQAWVKASF